MTDRFRPSDELIGLRDLLARLESGSLKMSRAGQDVTQQEFAVLKREMAHLEMVLARLRAEQRS
jgi:hypothetical protein